MTKLSQTCACLILLAGGGWADAEMILFESAELGETGIVQGEVVGANVNEFTFPGVRFELSQPSRITGIGGHFAAGSPGQIFGALIQLDSLSDFPDSTNLSTPDVLAATLFSPAEESSEVFGSLDFVLDPGAYAVAFGSGLFGANGTAVIPLNGAAIDGSSFIVQEVNLNGWVSTSGTLADLQFISVRGTPVPESSNVALLALLLHIIAISKNGRHFPQPANS